jgi:SAM-dependent methyltransferase
MARRAPFATHHRRYEAWFERHRAAYLSELLALRPFVPLTGRGLEIGVGTGRFAAPLGVALGVDPSPEMLAYAAARGIETIQGVAEALPFTDASFDHALVVTTICFVDAPAQMLAEAHRVLRPGGRLVLGFIDRDSALGQDYLAHQAQSLFYRAATFYRTAELEQLLRAARFTISAWAQTLVRPLAATHEIEPVRPGHGSGAFVVIRAERD